MTFQSQPPPPRRLGFRLLCGFLLLLPFGLMLPGTPGGLKGDEAAYYLMAMSLAHDGDTRLATEDTERLFDEFSTRRTANTVVLSTDGWETVHYGKPHLYSLLAAPFARAFGYRGMLLFNVLLLLGSVVLLARYLAFSMPAPAADLFAAAFLLLGATWTYTFWIEPEILGVFAVAGSLALGLRRPHPDGGARLPSLPLALGSGALLALAVYSKPYLAPLGLVFLVGAVQQGRGGGARRESLRWFAAWSAGAALVLALAGGSAWLLTGSPSSYIGVQRDSVPVICGPGEEALPPSAIAARTARDGSPSTPERDIASASASMDAPEAPAVQDKSWAWIFRIPPVTFGENVENLVYFLIGRHTGLLVYFPFVAVSLLLFAAALLRRRREGRRDALAVDRWTLLASAFGIGLFLLVFISWNWQGGGGFVGNRYYVMVVPAYAFLVSELRPWRALAAGAVAAGIFLGPLLLSPFGLLSPEPTLQAHTRSGPLAALPLELTLKNVPGYRSEALAGMRIVGREDRWLRRGPGFWVYGRQATELLALSTEPHGATAFLVRGVTEEPSAVRISFGGAEETVTLAADEDRIVILDPVRQRRRHNPNHLVWHVADLDIEADGGRLLPWQRHMPRNPCPSFARDDVYTESFFAGALVTPLGPAERLQRDVFGVEWLDAGAPASMRVGERLEVPIRLRNTSTATWPAGGGATVNLSYHWTGADGESLVFDGRRTVLPADVAPGETVALPLDVEAPPRPGMHRLVIDPVFEHVGWFSERGVEPRVVEIEVLPSAGNVDDDRTP